MKNIAVSLDEETYRLAHVRAAERGTSVSALVRAYLVALGQGQVIEADFDDLRILQDETVAAIHARDGGLRAGDNLPRDASHQRDAPR